MNGTNGSRIWVSLQDTGGRYKCLIRLRSLKMQFVRGLAGTVEVNERGNSMH